jgi:hypothetical protein
LDCGGRLPQSTLLFAFRQVRQKTIKQCLMLLHNGGMNGVVGEVLAFLRIGLVVVEFKGYQTRLQLFALAYNLGNFLRRLALPKAVRHWSLTTLRDKLIKIGAKVTRHSKYVTFQLAEVAITRNLFETILDRIARLAISPPVHVGGMPA